MSEASSDELIVETQAEHLVSMETEAGYLISVPAGSQVTLVVSEGTTVDVVPGRGLRLESSRRVFGVLTLPEETGRERDLHAGVSCNDCGIVVRATR